MSSVIITASDRVPGLCLLNVLLGLSEVRLFQVLPTCLIRTICKDGRMLLMLYTKKGLISLSRSSTETEPVWPKLLEVSSRRPPLPLPSETLTSQPEKIMKFLRKWLLMTLRRQKKNSETVFNSPKKQALMEFNSMALMVTWWMNSWNLGATRGPIISEDLLKIDADLLLNWLILRCKFSNHGKSELRFRHVHDTMTSTMTIQLKHTCIW